MGPMNGDYSFPVGNTMLETFTTTSFHSFSLPTETLASTALVASCQSGRMEDIYQDQVLSNNSADFQPPDNSCIPSELPHSEQTFYNSDFQPSENMYSPNIVATPEQALFDSDFRTQEDSNNHTSEITTPIQTISGTLNEIGDGELKKAAEEMKKSGSQLPLLKRELWLKIQTSRLARGKPELKIEQEEPKNYELTPKEKQNLEKRRENNRQSAKKCRKRKRDETIDLFKKHGELIKKNRELKKMVEKLEKLKTHYWSELVSNCPVDTIPPEELHKYINPDFEEQLIGDGA